MFEHCTIAIETFLQECKHLQGEEEKKLTTKRSPEDENFTIASCASDSLKLIKLVIDLIEAKIT